MIDTHSHKGRNTGMTNRKYKDETWDFIKADTKEYTHCLHNYPAMMIPRLSENS